MPNFIYHSFSTDEVLDHQSTSDARFSSMAPDFYKGANVKGNYSGITNYDLAFGLQLHHLTDTHFDNLDIIKEAGQIVRTVLPNTNEREPGLQFYLIKAGIDIAYDGCILEVFGDAALPLYKQAVAAANDGSIRSLDKLTHNPKRFQEFIRRLAARSNEVVDYYGSPEHLFQRLQLIAARRNHSFSDKAAAQAIPVFAALRKHLLPHTVEIHECVTAALKQSPLLSLPYIKPLHDSSIVTLAMDPEKVSKYAHPTDTLYAPENFGHLGNTKQALFLMSRLALRQALSMLGSDDDNLTLPQRPGQPLALPEAHRGALTHTGVGAVAVGAIAANSNTYLGAGIDIESTQRFISERTLRAIVGYELTDSESTFLNSGQDLGALHVIKEACIKALFPLKGKNVRFKEVELCKTEGTWEAVISESLAKEIGSVTLNVLLAKNDMWQLAAVYALGK